MRPIGLFMMALGITMTSNGLTAWAAAPSGKTASNLETAIRAEANAANRYQLFSQKAEQEGFPQVAKLFRAASEAESIHRENHQLALLALGGPSVKVKLDPVKVADTRHNLELPIQGEAQERAVYYPRVIREAKMENDEQAVRTFTFARDTEAEHEQLFKRALAQLGKNPAENYYVSKISGDTLAIPEGRVLPKSRSEEYILVS